MRFNSPPGWPKPPKGWAPLAGWKPDPSWPDPPNGWQLWIEDDEPASGVPRPGTATGLEDTGDSTPVPSRAQQAVEDAETFPADDVDHLRARVAQLEAELARLKARGVSDPNDQRASSEVLDFDDQRALQDVGIYRYHHPLESAAAYKDQMVFLNRQIDALIKAGKGVLATDMFTYDGSLAKGRKMVSDLSKLMLRTYNAEADNCVRSLRAGNIALARKRLERSVLAVEKLGAMMEMRINPQYHALRIAELELTADHQMKLQEEREAAREAREQLREQRRVEAELAAERERLDKERAHYATVLDQLRAKGDDAAAADLAKPRSTDGRVGMS